MIILPFCSQREEFKGLDLSPDISNILFFQKYVFIQTTFIMALLVSQIFI